MFVVQNHRLEGNNYRDFKFGFDRRVEMPTPHPLDCVERHHQHFLPIQVINELKEVLETKFHMTEEKMEELVEQIDEVVERIEEIVPDIIMEEVLEEVLPIVMENLMENTPEEIIPELIQELVPFVMEQLIDNSVEPEELPKVEEKDDITPEPIEEETPEPFIITTSFPPHLPVEETPEPIEETSPVVDDDDTISVRSRQNSEPIPLLVQEYLEKAGLSTLKKLNLKVSQKIDISKKKK